MSIHNETCPKCKHVFEPDLAHDHDDALAEITRLRSHVALLVAENKALADALRQLAQEAARHSGDMGSPRAKIDAAIVSNIACSALLARAATDAAKIEGVRG